MRSLRTLPTPPRALVVTLACFFVVPAAASASTLTVDDDGADCPSAGFSSIQAAVNQAAPHDTIVVCPGLYREGTTPSTSAMSPAQAGSHNGLTITQPLTIRGAGASKVVIEPDPAVVGTTLAGTAPYLRDGGGNVISIERQSLGSTDADENRVDISGVTVRSPDVWAEAGVAFFNTSGSVSDSVVGPLKVATNATELAQNPHGYGVVETNSLQGTEAGPRREVTVRDSLVTGYQSGGVRFDDARGTDGAATTTQRSGIVQYGTVTGSRIEGRGPSALVPQTGVGFHAGQRGDVTGSEIVGNDYSPDPRRSVGVLLQDAETGTDPRDASRRAFSATGNAFGGDGYALFNADAANQAVRTGAPTAAGDDWWGCAAGPLVGFASSSGGCQGISGTDPNGAASVETGTPRTVAPAPLSVPGAVSDAAPTVSIDQPADGYAVSVGADVHPIVDAHDDFGVRSVALSVDGRPLGSIAAAPYEFSWTPTTADQGHTVALTATAVDSAGQATTTTIHVVVPAAGDAPVATAPPTVTATAVAGTPTSAASGRVGRALTCDPGRWTPTPTAFAYQWFRAGRTIAGATSARYVPTTADVGSQVRCRVTITSAAGTATAFTAGTPVSLTTSRTASATTAQTGPAIARIVRRVRGSAHPRLGTVRCVRPDARTCTTTVTGTLRVGSRRYAISTVARARSGHAASVRPVLTTAARKALSRRSGRLSLRLTTVDATGFRGSAPASVVIGRS